MCPDPVKKLPDPDPAGQNHRIRILTTAFAPHTPKSGEYKRPLKKLFPHILELEFDKKPISPEIRILGPKNAI